MSGGKMTHERAVFFGGLSHWTAGQAREVKFEMARARGAEDAMAEQLRQKDETISAAYVAPELLAWRAESPHGFSRVYARDAEQARERGAIAQRCAVDAISVERWPEEDLCKAGRKDEVIRALADALEVAKRRLSEPEDTTIRDHMEIDAALTKAGRTP